MLASTTEFSVTPARRTATRRAAGVQTPPGTYFASIESISAPSTVRYPSRIPYARKISCQPTTKLR